MKNQQYFLRLENATKAWFKVITEDVKIFVPSHMPQRFHKLMTDQNEKLCGPTPESDKAMLQSKYNGYDVFYLNISGLDDWDNSKEIRFDLSDKPDIVAAFVCIPKQDPGFPDRSLDVDFVRMELQDYYNDANNWYIFVMDKRCEELKSSEKYYDYVVENYLLCIWDDKFGSKDEDFFKTCKDKYGISQSEIDTAKNIILSNKQLKKYTFAITPELIKKLHAQQVNNTEAPMALPLVLDKNGFRQDLYATKHFLINGQTGTGKTILLKSILTSIDHQPKDANCKIILIDTKNFEFNEYSSEYLMTPVITNAQTAVEYLNQMQAPDTNVAIIIDELADLIAVRPDVQDILMNLAKNPKIHIIASTNRIGKLTNEFTDFFHGRMVFSGDKIGEYQYFSKAPYNFEQFYTKRSVL